MLDPQQVIGKQEVWENFITNVEMESTPFLDWLPTGPAVNALDVAYQADEYAEPAENSHVNGQPVTGFEAAGEGRGKLRALVHYATKTASVTKLHQDVITIAGVNDELGREINKKNKELSRDLEAWFLSDRDHREDNQVSGYVTRGVPHWIRNAAQGLYPVPEAFRTPAGSISAVPADELTEDIILDILESSGTKTKSNRGFTGFVGTRLKRAFNNMTLITPSSTLVGGTPTQSQGVVFTKPLSDRAVGRIIENYDSDFGRIALVMSFFNAAIGGNTIEKQYSGFFLHQDMWQLSWNQKPTWYRKAYQGGQYEAFCETVFMLKCKNPAGEAKYHPTAAT